jgi:hypothetical protein
MGQSMVKSSFTAFGSYLEKEGDLTPLVQLTDLLSAGFFFLSNSVYLLPFFHPATRRAKVIRLRLTVEYS